jgi:hypothetical protein
VSYHGRYQHPLMPFLFILAGDGLGVLLHKTGDYRVPRWAWAMLLAALTGILYFNLVSARGGYLDDKANLSNNQIWAVDWLKAHAPPGILVASHDIGILSYLGHYPLIDIGGLTDEEAMARNRAEQGQGNYLFARRPDYLVGDKGWLVHYLHYSAVLDCCATEVAVAHPNSLAAMRFRIYRMNWEPMEKMEVHPAAAPPAASHP